MAAQPPESTAAPWQSGQVTPNAYCVLAPNPGPMTLDGTNTWILLGENETEAIVIDPGPLYEPHLAEVLRVVGDRGARVTETVLTHHHLDHSEAGQRFGELTGSRVRAVGPATTTSPTGTCSRRGDWTCGWLPPRATPRTRSPSRWRPTTPC